MNPIGPFETTQEARAAAHTIVQPSPGMSILDEAQNCELLAVVCAQAGVENDAYDRRFLKWVAGSEDSMCGVFAGMLLRAHEAGKLAAMTSEENSK